MHQEKRIEIEGAVVGVQARREISLDALQNAIDARGIVKPATAGHKTVLVETASAERRTAMTSELPLHGCPALQGLDRQSEM